MLKKFSPMICFAGLCCLTSAHSADFTVSSGQTVTTTQVLSDPGDEGVIEDGGAIETTEQNAVEMLNGDNQSVLNDGVISTETLLLDYSGVGIYSEGDHASITNNGSISTEGISEGFLGLDGYGIQSIGADAIITNGGSISTLETNSSGIYSEGGNVIITNSGSISTEGSSADGILSTGATAEITNSGSISTVGIAAQGINSTADNAVITNAGTISTVLNNSRGISSSGAVAQITNSGSISTVEAGSSGIYSEGDNATITSGGDISTQGNSAYGIFSAGTNVEITNSGSISTIAISAPGIQSEGDNAFIKNIGSISTVLNGSRGISSTGSDAEIANSGNIATTGSGALGIVSLGVDAEIINSGSILTTGFNAHGISSNAVNATIKNTGTISTEGGDAYGIVSGRADAEITNSGSILTEGNDAYGVFISGANVKITNNGSILTTASRAVGIYSTANDAVITNNGNISTAGTSSHGIESRGDNSVITNSGIISTAGTSSHGIESHGDNSVITNSGIISTAGTSSQGVEIRGDNMVIKNNGVISATGSFTDGILLDGSNNSQIINSGTIISINGHAIDIDNSTNVTLTLDQGSNIQGTVRSESALNLNVGRGFNLLLTLTDDSPDLGQLDIASPYTIFNSPIIFVIDNTLFAIQEDMVADMSDTILGGISYNCCLSPCDCGVWTKTIGSYRNRSETDLSLKYTDWQLGQIVGYDSMYYDMTVGLFGGYLHGEGKTSNPLDKICQNNYFGGFSLAKSICNTCVGFTFAGGYVDWDEKLDVMDNLVVGGIDVFKGDNSAAFITSELSLMKQFCMSRINPKVTLSLRHAGLYLGDYTVEGTNQSVGIRGRDIDLLTTRLEVAIPSCAYDWALEPFVGVYGRYKLRGSHLKLEGNDMNFDVGLKDSLVAGVVGIEGSRCVCDKELTFSFSGDFDNERSSRFVGSLGIYF